MPRIAKRLAGPALVATGPTTIYTVPAVTKTIIRHIHLMNPSASAVTWTMSIGADATGTRLFGAYSIGPNQPFDHFCMYVMDAAEILTVSAGTNNILTITVDGDESVLG